MLSTMTVILEEKVSQPLLDVILQNLLKEEKVKISNNAELLHEGFLDIFCSRIGKLIN